MIGKSWAADLLSTAWSWHLLLPKARNNEDVALGKRYLRLNNGHGRNYRWAPSMRNCSRGSDNDPYFFVDFLSPAVGESRFEAAMYGKGPDCTSSFKTGII